MKRRLLVPTMFGTKSYTQKIRTLFGSSIIGYWPLDDPVGSSVARDISGNGFNGTPTGVTFGTAGMGDGRTSANIGTGNINFASPAALDNLPSSANGFSLLFWLKPNLIAAGFHILFKKFSGFDTDGHYIAWDTANRLLTVRVNYNTTDAIATTGVNSFPTDVWYHASMTFQGGNILLYKNGVDVTTNPTAGSSVYQADAANNFIYSEGSTPSYLQHAIVLNVVATPTQIAQAAKA